MAGALACAAAAQVTFTGSQFSVGAGNMASPAGLALDGQGRLFVADTGNGRILLLAPSTNGFGSSTTLLAGLSSPGGVAADWSGNLFIADTGNNRILMLPHANAEFGEPVALGSGFNSPEGIAVDSAANLFVADSGNNRIVELPLTSAGYGAPKTVVTGLNNPSGLAVDRAENLYIVDTGNHRVELDSFTLNGYVFKQTVAINLTGPAGVSVDKNGNVYVADSGSGRVLEWPWFPGAGRFNPQITIGSNLISPQAVTEDGNGRVYAADAASNQVVEIVEASVDFDAQSVGASGTKLQYNFNIGAGTAVGVVGIYAQGLSRADYVDAGGSSCIPNTYAAATACGIDIAFTPLTSGKRNGAVVIYDPQGHTLATAFFSGVGLQPQAAFFPGTTTVLGDQLSGPMGVDVDGSGNIYVADTGNNRVVVIPRNANGYGAQETVPISGLMNPMGLTVDGAGNLYVVSNGNDKVVKLPWQGVGFGPQYKVGVGFYGPSEAAVDGHGNLYITDTLDNRIDEFAWTGNGFATSQSLGSYQRFPGGLAVGGNGNVYFANPYMGAVEELPWNGSNFLMQRQLQTPDLSFPSALAVDGNSNLYILDAGNNRVVMLPWNGVTLGSQLTVAGGFNAPGGMALDGNGNLYVADTGNNRVVKVCLGTPAAMSFANTYLGSTSKDSAQTALVENVGNRPLAIGSLSYPADFPENMGADNPCAEGTSIAQGGFCQISVQFTPVTLGAPLGEAIQIQSNTLGALPTPQLLLVGGSSNAKLEQTITFPASPILTYGSPPIALKASASSGLSIAYSVVSGPAAQLNGGSALSIIGAGTIVLEASQAGNSVYNAAPAVFRTITIAPAILTVTPQNVTVPYGSALGSFPYSISGFVSGQNAAQVVTGVAAVSSGLSRQVGAGIYTLTASQGTLSAKNYIFVFANGRLTVTNAWLKVTAVSVSTTYGKGIASFAWNLSGFVNGDAVTAVTGTPNMTPSGSTGLSTGRYPITPSLGTLAAANYNFSFISATLTVVPAALAVTAVSQSAIYGGAVPPPTYLLSGFLPGDSAANAVSGSPAIATAAPAHPGSGKYAIAVSLGTLASANYIFTFVPGVLTVGQAQLTFQPCDAAMIYGGRLPSLSYTASGFVNGDTLSTSFAGAPALATIATSRSVPGSYAITAGPGTLYSRNYAYSFGSGVLTVAQATLTVKPRALAMTYGGPMPAFAFDYSGFVNGEGSSVVSGAPVLTTAASQGSPAGSYSINAAVGSLSANNYKFWPISGVITVNKAVVTVSPVAASMIYGGSLPAFTTQVAGLVNGDSLGVISGTVSFRTTGSSVSPVGTYPVQVEVVDLLALNYSLVPASGQLTVTPALLTVQALNGGMTYGSVVPVVKFAVTGLVNGESLSGSTTGAPLVTNAATSSTPAGVYPISAAPGSLVAKNYKFAFQAGSFEVSKAMLTVTAKNLSMKAGAAVPPLVYGISGFVNPDTVASGTTGTPALTTSATPASTAGSYVIVATQGSVEAANYLFTFVNGTLTIQR